MSEATLLVIQGADQGARFELTDQPMGLGRGAQNEVRILDTEVSRLHASIQKVRDAYVVTDRNSSNGTFVNGTQIRSRALAHGDRLQLGRTVLLFLDEPVSPDPANPDAVEILPRQDAGDRSSIVSQVAPDVLRSLGVGSQPAADQSHLNLNVLYRLAEEVVQPTASIDQLLQRVLDLTIEAVGGDRGCILRLEDPTSDRLVLAAVNQGALSSGSSSGQTGSDRMPVSRTIVDYVMKTGQGVRTTDAQHDNRFETTPSILQARIREALCVPLQGRHQQLGVIYIDTTTRADEAIVRGDSRFGEEHLKLMLTVARQAGLAVENNQFQQAFIKAERLAAMGQTIATLSHHIKNILQGVRGGSYLIDLGLKDHNEELVRKGWGIVEKNQTRIYHLVMDMLTFSKERQPSPQRAQLNDTVREVFELMQARAAECHVILELKADPALPDSTFDPEGIHRAVLNVVGNAIDAVEGADHAMVQIETGWDPQTDHLFVAVSDNGPGIPDQQLTRIFQLFESTKGARGTGLGLAVSQKILREHGGEIQVTSKLGEGSRFTLIWPKLEDDPQGSPLGRTQV